MALSNITPVQSVLLCIPTSNFVPNSLTFVIYNMCTVLSNSLSITTHNLSPSACWMRQASLKYNTDKKCPGTKGAF